MHIEEKLLKYKILIIDGSKGDQASLASILNKYGFRQIINAYNTENIGETIKTYEPDILIIDVSVIELSGQETSLTKTQVKSESEWTQIAKQLDVFVVAQVSGGEKKNIPGALEIGVNDWICKPYNEFEVLTRIRNLCSLKLATNRISGFELQKRSNKSGDVNNYTLSSAFYDRKTGFPNAMFLQHRIADIVYKDGKNEFVCYLVYLNHFDEINNVLGYQNGNRLLLKVALRLNDIASKIDGIISFGSKNSVSVLHGVNFLLLTDKPGSDDKSSDDKSSNNKSPDEKTSSETKIIETAKVILHELHKPFDFQGMSLDIGAIIGISSYPDHGDNYEQLVQHCQIATEIALHSIDQYAIYSPDVDPYSARRLSLMVELRNAIKNDQIFLYFQPQIDTLTNTVTGLEALVRWNHETHGFIPPDEFITLAEQTGVIKPLTRWVLDAALKTSAKLLDQDIPLRMSVNISPLNLQEEGLDDYIFELLAKYSLPNDLLVIELTESAMMSDKAGITDALNNLDSKEVKISIDDFGTGYSSLTYLKQLPLDELKIDKSFVMDMMSDTDDLMIVHTTIEMAHNLGLGVVAEGVEDNETFEQLRDMGCNTVQGYYFSKPKPIIELLEMFEKGELSVSEF